MPETKRVPTSWPAPTALIGCLLAFAIIAVILGVTGSVLVAVAYSREISTGSGARMLFMALPLAGGCTLACVLWALAWQCRWQYRRSLLQRQIAAGLEALTSGRGLPSMPVANPALLGTIGQESEHPAPPALPGNMSEAVPAHRQEALLEQLRELNVNLLLTDAQRELKRRYVTGQETNRLVGLIDRAIGNTEFRQAEELLDRLTRVAPDWPQLAELRLRIDQARSQAETRDVEFTSRQVCELMAAGEFGQARLVSGDLLARYPNSPAASELAARVAREREAYVAEQRARLYKQVETEAAARHWRPALAAAQELLTAHPQCHEADAVRAQLDTLQDNAQIEEVRELRDRIRELFTRRRFGEALELARDVVQRFPHTAAAEELRQQLGRLEELARGQVDEQA